MISVGLPIYNQTNVMHIALEGLCRQENAGRWELIISSEDDIWEIVDKYLSRLREVGMVSVVYDKIPKWIPLSKKWQRIGQLMLPGSVGLILHAGDCYSHPQRIRQSRQAMEDGYYWYNESVGYFYHLGKKLLTVYDKSMLPPGEKSHLNMCMSSYYAKRIPDATLKKSIDRWLLRGIPLRRTKTKQVDNVHKGVDLHGMNNISKERGCMIENGTNGFKKVSLCLGQIGLPEDVVLMINELHHEN